MTDRQPGRGPAPVRDLLEKTDFAGLAGSFGMRKQAPIVGPWRVLARGELADTRIQPAPPAGAALSWGPGCEMVQLRQDLIVSALPPAEGGHVLTLRIRLEGERPAGEVIERVAVVEERDGRSHTLARFSFEGAASGGGTVLTGAATIDEFAEGSAYQLAILFKAAALAVTVHAVQVEAAPFGASPWPPPRPRAGPPGRRRKAVVIAWDMGHNPVGRAYLIADMLSATHDVELIGPLFARYGAEVWAPIRKTSIPLRTFACVSMADFLEQAVEAVRDLQPDVIFACKARLPSMLLAMLLKHRTGRPVILDVDDHELSFFPPGGDLALADLDARRDASGDLDLPFGETWTRVAERLIGGFDGLTVSNPALRGRFGGVVVRHARDEAAFRPEPAVRERVRRSFGFGPGDRVILFLGTPRPHKGVYRLAAALERLADPRLVLCMIGSPRDARVEARLAGFKRARLQRFPDQPWERLPDLVQMADGVCLLQESDSPIARWQIPAKLTDALALGVPVAVSDVAPFGDLPSPEAVERLADDDALDAFLRSVADGRCDATADRERRRACFLAEFSYAVNRARLELVGQEAAAAVPAWPQEWSLLLQRLARCSPVPLPTAPPDWSAAPRGFPGITGYSRFNLAFFWKQNDSGVYGRRHDMFVRHLARHPRIERIVQFDAALAVNKLEAMVREDEDAHLDQGNLVAENTLRRFLGTHDDAKVARRVFLHRGAEPGRRFLGRDLPSLDDYPEWAARTLREAVGPGPVASWVAPVVPEYPAIHDRFGFDLTIADLVDDQRAMTELPAKRAQLHRSYVETLRRADLVLANNAAVAAAFGEVRDDITVVPNAADPAPWEAAGPAGRPPGLPARGPVIGYIGNLRDRIDVPLIARLARRDPNWSIVLIGSAHGRTDVLSLRELPNVHFLGVKRYEEAVSLLRGFDVAVMPHLNNAVSRFMNPLKLYVYLAAGAPIVTTAVANIEDVAPYAAVAEDHEDFVAKVEAALARRRLSPPAAVPLPAELCWPARVEAVMRLIRACGAVESPPGAAA